MRLGVTYRAPGATKSGVVPLKGDVFQVISADQHGAYRLADDPDSTYGQQPHADPHGHPLLLLLLLPG